MVATTPYLFDDYHGKRSTELLGLADNETPETAVGKLPTSGDGRALVILLGMVLGTMEAKTSKNAWRGADTVTRSYLRFLDENGYTLSDIEQVVIGNKTSEGVYAEYCR